MGTGLQKAEALFDQGYNCAQAVFAAFHEDVGLDKETALMLTSSFGGGMGRLKEVCGAVSAMFMVAGLKYGYTVPDNKEEKLAHYQGIQALAARFKEKAGSIICRDLLDGDFHQKPAPGSDKLSCKQLVGLAAGLTEEMLEQGEMPA